MGYKPSVFENNPCSHLAERGGLSPPSHIPHGLPMPPPNSCPPQSTQPAAFLSPSPGRTNGLIQEHPARSVSLRQSCAQLCVKNGMRLPGEQAGLVGANCRGFVNACGFPRDSGQAGPPLPLKCQAAWLGALSRPGTDSLLHIGPHPSSCELRRAGMWGRDLPWPLHCRQVLLRKGLWTLSPGPWERTCNQPCLMDQLFHVLTPCQFSWRGHWGSEQHAHFIEEETEAPTGKRQTQVTWLPRAGSRTWTSE